MIKVSIIVPVYNTEIMLKTCIESLINQTLKEIEIIFIDDGSTDVSLSILSQYQKIDNRIRVLCNEKNLGEAASRNRGLSVVNGKYTMFVDSDDYIDLDTIENLYTISELHHADMCYLGMQIHTEKDNNKLRVQQSIQGNYPNVYDGKTLIGEFVKNREFFLYLCSVFYQSSFIKKYELKFKKLSIGLGGDFILRALCCATRVLVCSEKYYHYRVHGNSVMHSANAKQELLIGQIVQYIDILHYFSSFEDSKELAIFLEDLWKKIAGGIQNLSADERSKIEHRLETEFAKHIFHMLQQNKHTYGIVFNKDILQQIRKKAFVIIYGAGYASEEIIELLHKHEIEILGFAVTKRREGQKCIYGHHVYEIQELVQYKDNAIILVASNKIYNQEIQNILNTYEFQDYIFLNVEI